MDDPDQREHPVVKLAHEVCRPNTLFRETDTGDVWRLNAWTATTVTVAAWDSGHHAVYLRETFERAIAAGQFEKIPTVFEFDADPVE